MAKQRLIENFSIGPNSFKRIDVLNEDKKQIIYKGQKFKCIAAYTVPLSRPDLENLNGRIYSTELWQNVITNQQKVWEGSYGLCDHPKESEEDGGSVKDIFCVWHNLRFSKDRTLVLGDMYLFGSWGQHAQEAIEAGGRIGLSTSGFGDFESDKKTVEADTYELERPSDWVLHPSYEVYGSINDQIQGMDVEESVSISKEALIENNSELSDSFASDMDYVASKTKLSPKSITNVVSENSRENNPMVDKLEESKISLLEQKNLKLGLNEMFQSAEKAESLTEKVNKYNDILEYCEGFETMDFVREKVSVAKEKVKSLNEQILTLAEKGKTSDVLQEKVSSVEKEVTSLKEKSILQSHDLETISEEHERALDLLDSMKVYTKKLKEMYEVVQAEKNGMVKANTHREALMYVRELEEQIEKLMSEKSKLRKSLRRLKRKYEDIDNDNIDSFRADVRNADSELEPGGDDEDLDDASEYSDDGGAIEPVSDQRPDHVGPGFSAQEDYFGRNEEVMSYYEDILEENPNVKRIKEQILGCRTVFEAQKLYMNLEDLLNEPTPYKKSRSKKTESTPVQKQVTAYEPSIKKFLEQHQGWV